MKKPVRIRNYLQFIFRLASGQISEIVPEFRIGFVDRFGSADRDGPVAVQRRYRRRHGDPVVVVAADRSAVNRSADDPHLVLRLDVHRNSHAAENVGEGLGAVALLVDEPVCASDDRSAVAVGGERGERREKVGAVRRVEFERVQFVTADGDRIGRRRDFGPGPGQGVDDGRVGL